MEIKSKKSIISLILVLTIIFNMIPFGAFKVYAEGETNYNLWIGGTQVTSDNLSGEGWSYNPSTTTLTLNNYNYSAATTAADGICAVINSKSDIIINLVGTNIIEEKSVGTENSFGIRVDGHKLTFKGSGTLTASGTTISSTSGYSNCGILVGELVLDKTFSGTINANGGNSSASNAMATMGICASSITVNNGTLNAYGGTASNRYASSTGIFMGAPANLTINGGIVKAQGGQGGTSGVSAGIWLYGEYEGETGKLIVGKNATLTAIGTEARISYGLTFENSSRGSVNIASGANVTCYSTNTTVGDSMGDATSCGMRLDNNSLISNGNLTTYTLGTSTRAKDNLLAIWGGTGAYNIYEGKGYTNSAGTEGETILATEGTTNALSSYKRVVTSNAPQYTIDFDTDGGSTIATQTIDAGGKVVKPADPTKSGYKFDGWYTDTSFSTEFDFNSTITSDKTIYAKWSLYTARFSARDIADYETLEGATLRIFDGNNQVAEWVSTTANREVSGLFSGKEYTLRAVYAPDGYTIPADITFTIGTDGAFTTTGSTATDSSNNPVLLVEFAKTHVEVSSVKESDNSTLSGATIQVLDKDGNVVEEWSSTNSNHAIEGLITKEEYTLRVTVVPDSNLYEIPSDITFTISEEGTITSTGSMSGSTLLVSIPGKATYSATFNLNYDNQILQTINNLPSGSKVNAPNPSPTRNGYIFDGWFKDQTCAVPYDFENDTITTNTIIYAKWNQKRITFQLDGATVSGNIITFDVDGTEITVTPTGSGYYFDENNLVVNVNDLNNVKLVLSDNFDSSKMSIKLHDGQQLVVTGDNEAIFDGLNFENDDCPHLSIINSGGEAPGPVGGSEDITFSVSWDNTYVIVDINGKEVFGDVDNSPETFTANMFVEQAGETDPTKTNIIKLTPRMGDYEFSECTINGVVYTKDSDNVEIYDFGWFITVPGATSYTISATGDTSIPRLKTIIWVNPDFVPENEEEAQWVADFTITHGAAKVIEVYDQNNNLVDPSTYVGMDADQYGLKDGFGWVAIPAGSRVVFEFIPEYGYQLTSIAINETPLDAIDSSMNRFEINIPDNSGNLHFAATFSKTEDVVKANSTKVSSGEISLGNGLEAGTAQLVVSDVQLSSDKIKDFENAAGDYTIANYLDIDLYNVFYKGKDDDEDVWSGKIDELDKEATISLVLADGLTADDIILVHNIHDGDEYEIIQIESYNPSTNTITFKAKSFSNYAIASKASSNEDTTSDVVSPTNTTPSSSPKTGDNITMWISLMVISTIGVFVSYKNMGKKTKIRLK